jgi:hypothetical protein
MAGFANDIRGAGLVYTFQALGDLEEDPLHLDRVRRRYDDAPPPYRSSPSNPSGTPTRSASPVTLSEQQRQSERRRWKLKKERDASFPYSQFDAQHHEERKRLWDADPRSRGLRLPQPGGPDDKMAFKTVKNRWKEQCIWKNEWNNKYRPDGRWKHEEPLELESESHSEAESSAPISLFGPPQPKRKPKSDEEKRRIAERRVARQREQEREREASRPYHQFIYQISKERERIEKESTSVEGTETADINTKAYENVKNTWIKRGIWNQRWGVLPGMSWKHEEPLEQVADNDPVPIQNAPLVNHRVVEVVPRSIFGPPATDGPSHRQESSIVNGSQQVEYERVVSSSLENGHAEQPPSTSSSPLADGVAHHPAMRPALRSSKQKPSRKDLSATNASLGPVHSTKISKPARKKRSGPSQQPNTSQMISSDDPQLSSTDHTTPRRSKRLESRREPSVELTMAASRDPSERRARSKPKRKAAGNLTSRDAENLKGYRDGGRLQRGKQNDG